MAALVVNRTPWGLDVFRGLTVVMERVVRKVHLQLLDLTNGSVLAAATALAAHAKLAATDVALLWERVRL